MEIYQSYFSEKIEADQDYTCVQIVEYNLKTPTAVKFILVGLGRSVSKCGTGTT
jgi:hypothetical protein